MPDLELLRDLGDRVIPPPLDSLRETARVRDRRTRTATVVASAAAVAGVASFVFLGGLRNDKAAPEPVEPPDVVTTRPLTYADGVTVHYGDQTVTAAGPVKELDVTDAGVGFRTADGRIWFTDGSDPVELGSVGRPPAPFTEGNRPYAVAPGWVVSGNAGSLLAWFDFAQPEAPEMVVYDTRAGEITSSSEVVVPSGELAYPLSIHDDAAFWMVEEPEGEFGEEPVPDMRLDLTTGVAAPISPQEYLAELGSSPARTFLISHAERGFKVEAITDGTGHQFGASAKGRIEAAGGQPLEIHDGLTDQQLDLRAPAGFESKDPIWAVQWLADDRIVLWPWGGDQVQLLECPVPTGTCEIAVTGPESIVVPFYGTEG